MELPEDVLAIIKEFSKPLNRPKWRTLHKMTLDTYSKEYMNINHKRWHILAKDHRIIYKPIFSSYQYLWLFHGIRYRP
jgi:hypothetical protein